MVGMSAWVVHRDRETFGEDAGGERGMGGEEEEDGGGFDDGMFFRPQDFPDG